MSEFDPENELVYNGIPMPQDLLDAYILANSTFPQDMTYITANLTYWFLANRHDASLFMGHNFLSDSQLIQLGRAVHLIHYNYGIPIGVGSWLLDHPEGQDLVPIDGNVDIEVATLHNLINSSVSSTFDLLAAFYNYTTDEPDIITYDYGEEDLVRFQEYIEAGHFFPVEAYLNEILNVLESDWAKSMMRELRMQFTDFDPMGDKTKQEFFQPIKPLYERMLLIAYDSFRHYQDGKDLVGVVMLFTSSDLHSYFGIDESIVDFDRAIAEMRARQSA